MVLVKWLIRRLREMWALEELKSDESFNVKPRRQARPTVLSVLRPP